MATGVQFVSLNSIVTDLLLAIRGSKVSQSEPISKRQLENWIHQYRALLIKRELDKGREPHQDYIQSILGLEMEMVDYTAGLTNVAKGEYFLRSKLQIPSMIGLNHKEAITYLGTIDGHEIQLINETRSRWQKEKRWTGNDKVAFLRDNYICIANDTSTKFVDIRGVFEVPTEVTNFVNANTSQDNYLLDDAYPIPISMIPTLKEMILKGELNIEARAYSDQQNDSKATVEPNVEQPVKAQR